MERVSTACHMVLIAQLLLSRGNNSEKAQRDIVLAQASLTYWSGVIGILLTDDTGQEVLQRVYTDLNQWGQNRLSMRSDESNMHGFG
jgi:hypothetical protein